MQKLIDRARAFVASEIWLLTVFLIAYAAAILDIAAIGVAVLLLLLILLVLTSEDIYPALLPLLLCHALTFLCPDAKWLFWLAIPGVAALIYRFIRNLRNVKNTYALPGLVAVAVAVSVGGLFSITPAEYCNPDALLCVLGLGVAVIAVYFLVKGSAPVQRDYCVADRVAMAMYLIGVFIAFLILRLFIIDPGLLENENVGLLLSSTAIWRNSAATVVVMSLPFIFYFAVKHHPIHLLSAVLVYGAAVISGSRGAAVCGAITFLMCVIYLLYYRKKMRLPILIAGVACLAAAFVFRGAIIDFCTSFLRFSFDWEELMQEARVQYIFRSVEDFLEAPIFGRGFAYTGNTDINEQAANWYHSLFPQLFGGLGIVGVLAYGYQFFLRVRLLAAAPREPFSVALILAYVGALIYSQIDPGIFSPYPFAILLVFFFVLAEESAMPNLLLRKRKKTPEA